MTEPLVRKVSTPASTERSLVQSRRTDQVNRLGTFCDFTQSLRAIEGLTP
jgi:hypothetical protein